MVPTDSTKQTQTGANKSERLYYLDWLRVLLIIGVFLLHNAGTGRTADPVFQANAQTLRDETAKKERG